MHIFATTKRDGPYEKNVIWLIDLFQGWAEICDCVAYVLQLHALYSLDWEWLNGELARI